MRKFTIALLLAATAIPAMATAQEEGGRQWRQQDDSDKSDKRSGEDRQRQNDQRQQQNEQHQAQNEQRQQAQAERQAQMQQMQAARQQQQQVQQQQVQQQQQGEQQNDRRAQFEQMRAARQQQAQQQSQQQDDRRAQFEQAQAARQAQQQAQRQARSDQQDGDRERAFGGRGSREADGRSRDEQMRQYRAEMEQRRAGLGGQPNGVPNGVPGGALVGRDGRDGRYRGIPNINPNTVGRPAPENLEARFAHRDDRDRNQWSGNQWTNNWRHDNRYDWQRYRNQHHSVFRIGFYFDPFGYSYNRFGIGSYMYPGYYQSNYWINDPWQYRLPPAYGPYRWIRYHNDALMIDTWSGEVVDVIYGFFW